VREKQQHQYKDHDAKIWHNPLAKCPEREREKETSSKRNNDHTKKLDGDINPKSSTVMRRNTADMISKDHRDKSNR